MRWRGLHVRYALMSVYRSPAQLYQRALSQGVSQKLARVHLPGS